MQIGYVNVNVSNFDVALDFYTNIVGLTVNAADPEFGYASFNAGSIAMGIAQTDDPNLVGKHTGIGFIVKDIDAEYERMLKLGVEFDKPPTKQPWGGVLALFKDPDGNIFYLDPGHS